MTDTLAAPRRTGPDDPAGPAAARNARRQGRWSTRWRLVVCIAIVVVALGWVAVRGLTGSFVYYLTPTDVTVGHKAQVDQRIRLGGFVVPGSVRGPDSELSFRVTDGQHSLLVLSTAPVPRMFRAGQGVVVEGALGADGRFHSDTMLVKHDGEYRAPDPVDDTGGR